MGRGKRGDFGKKDFKVDLGAGSAPASARTITKPPTVLPVMKLITPGSFSFGRNVLPKDNSQLEHMFSDRPGHLKYTKENVEKILKIANDSTKLKGITFKEYPKKGSKAMIKIYIQWYEEITPEGQYWAKTWKGIIRNCGINLPGHFRPWDSETGFDHNPNK